MLVGWSFIVWTKAKTKMKNRNTRINLLSNAKVRDGINRFPGSKMPHQRYKTITNVENC